MIAYSNSTMGVWRKVGAGGVRNTGGSTGLRGLMDPSHCSCCQCHNDERLRVRRAVSRDQCLTLVVTLVYRTLGCYRSPRMAMGASTKYLYVPPTCRSLQQLKQAPSEQEYPGALARSSSTAVSLL